MPNVLISIIVPCYNQAQYLDECLQSVLDQTYHDWECIIVNDGSTDNGLEKIKKFTDNRIKIFQQENQGVSVARNKGIIQALEEKLGAKLYICDEAQLCVALVAALFAYEKCNAAR